MTRTHRFLLASLPLTLTLALACNDDTPTEAGTETETGDGDGDPGDGDGAPGDGDGAPGDGDGAPGDGDGAPGDGDGAPGDGDGAPGDGDGAPGDGDGDGAPPDVAELRVLHLGVDAPPVDVYVDGAVDPAIVGLEFQQGTAYVPLEPGLHSFAVTPTGDPNTVVLALDDIDLLNQTKYSAVAYDYLANISALLLVDDDAGVDPANTRVQVSHTAPDVGQVDIWVLADPPVLLIENLDYAATTSVDIPAGPAPIGIDADDDMIPDLVFDIPDLGGGTFVDLYAVNEAGGAPVFLLAHLPDGSTARIDTTVCGNDIAQGSEVCDGTDVGAMTCADFGADAGTLGCLADCSNYDTSMCYTEIQVCNDNVTPIPDGQGPNNAAVLPIEVLDVGAVVNVRVSVDITHPNLTDLDVSLNRNNQGNTWLFRDIRDAADNALFCAGDDMVAMLEDGVAESIQTNACMADLVPAVDGTYAPQQTLANFAGVPSDGIWNLVVDDDTNGNVGDVNQWCIYLGIAQ